MRQNNSFKASTATHSSYLLPWRRVTPRRKYLWLKRMWQSPSHRFGWESFEQVRSLPTMIILYTSFVGATFWPMRIFGCCVATASRGSTRPIRLPTEPTCRFLTRTYWQWSSNFFDRYHYLLPCSPLEMKCFACVWWSLRGRFSSASDTRQSLCSRTFLLYFLFLQKTSKKRILDFPLQVRVRPEWFFGCLSPTGSTLLFVSWRAFWTSFFVFSWQQPWRDSREREADYRLWRYLLTFFLPLRWKFRSFKRSLFQNGVCSRLEITILPKEVFSTNLRNQISFRTSQTIIFQRIFCGLLNRSCCSEQGRSVKNSWNGVKLERDPILFLKIVIFFFGRSREFRTRVFVCLIDLFESKESNEKAKWSENIEIAPKFKNFEFNKKRHQTLSSIVTTLLHKIDESQLRSFFDGNGICSPKSIRQHHYIKGKSKDQ